jgi:predicted phage-related endonuclease
MMTNEQMNAKITQIELLEAQIKELKAIVDSTKGDLKAELDERKVDMIDTGFYHIFYELYDKKSVDTKKLKADGLYDQYAKTTTSTMFKITVVQND